MTKNLTPEEEEIVHKRSEETKRQNEQFKLAMEYAEKGDMETFRKIVGELNDSIPDVCEHGRSIWSPCLACHELDVKLGLEDEEVE